MARIIAISNQKGGVGKTTTAVNLGACLAAAEQRVLLVDMDPQGNATSGLGVDKHSDGGSLYDVLVHDEPIRNIVRQTELSTLHVAPSNTDLVGAEVELTSALAREHVLADKIEAVESDYDWIIIDCAPSLGLLTVNALTAADAVLIPLQTEYYALEGLGELTRTIRLIQRRLNPRLVLEGVLLTLYDGRNRLNQQVAADVQRHFGDKVFETIIPRNVRLGEAPSFGKPIILYDIDAKGAQAYMGLTRELLARHGIQVSRQTLTNAALSA
ncbi:MAG: ParA family protein [Deltaproteobacteria bacterium]|nr:ParA family protein [Deltaproteobacteria bacterium]